MDLKMEVYTPGLELVGMLEIYNAVLWEEKAFAAGNFSVSSLITDESRAFLVKQNMIWIEGDTAGIIEHIDQKAGDDGPYITVKGRTLTSILERRIMWGLYDLSGTAPEIMRYLVDDCCIHPTRGDTEARKIPGLVMADYTPVDGLPAIRIQKTGGNLLELLESLGETYDIAFGVRFNPQLRRMEFWVRPGVDRSIHQTIRRPVFYSTELDDVLQSEYTYDSSNFRNVALVAGEGEGNQRTMITVEEESEEEPDIPTPPEPVKYTVSLSVSPAGGGVATGGGTVEAGTSVTVLATSASGYTFSGWQDGGNIVSTDLSYTFTATGNRNLTAVFSAVVKKYNISVSADPQSGGTASGGGSFDAGKSVTVMATPANGYEFVAWKESGNTVSTNASYTFSVTSDRNLMAVFAAIVPVYVITTKVDPSGGGTVSGGGSYEQGTTVTLTQTAADGYRFVGWYNATGSLLSNEKSYTFTSSRNMSVTAKYSAIPVFTVTTTVDPSGSGTVTGGGIYQEGQTITVTAAPADGYEFSNWQEDGVSVSTDISYTFTAESNRNLVAVFEEQSSISSTLGKVWTQVTALPSPTYPKTYTNLTFGNGAFLAGHLPSNASPSLLRSTDGKTWKVVGTGASSSSAKYVWFAAGKFFCSANKTNALRYSATGETSSWTSVNVGVAPTGYWIVVETPEDILAIDSGSTKCYRSTDGGLTWAVANALPATLTQVAFGGGCLFGTVNSTAGTAYISRDNGNTWTAVSGAPKYTSSIFYHRGKFYCCGASQGYGCKAFDPVTNAWTDLSNVMYASDTSAMCGFGGSEDIVVCLKVNAAVVSKDGGSSWETVTLPAKKTWTAPVFGNDMLVALDTAVADKISIWSA